MNREPIVGEISRHVWETKYRYRAHCGAHAG